jgi:hypothetical protein
MKMTFKRKRHFYKPQKLSSFFLMEISFVGQVDIEGVHAQGNISSMRFIVPQGQKIGFVGRKKGGINGRKN